MMKYILTILILSIVGYVSLNRSDNKSQSDMDIDQNHSQNIIIEPSLYSKLGTNHIEISAKQAINDKYKIILDKISAKLYQEHDKILARLIAPTGVVDIESKILIIDQGLLVQSDKFSRASESCMIIMNDNAVVFYKPKVEIL